MDTLVNYFSRRYVLASFVAAIFMVYPNIVCLPYELAAPEQFGNSSVEVLVMLLVVRFVYFWALLAVLLRFSLFRALDYDFGRRLLCNAGITAVAYGLFVVVLLAYSQLGTRFYVGSVVIFQFIMVCGFATLAGHILMLGARFQEKEIEIQRLKAENLQSRYSALTSQINPHFFFNAMSGIASLVRSGNIEKTLALIDKLSDVFRYILQSNTKRMVTLAEELMFLDAFRFVAEVRYAGKLHFCIDIPDAQRSQWRLPVLSLLPLVENVVSHNRIDSDHQMTVRLTINAENCLVVSNPICLKSCDDKGHGIGLKNLDNRFSLLSGSRIRTEDDGKTFTVWLPLR